MLHLSPALPHTHQTTSYYTTFLRQLNCRLLRRHFRRVTPHAVTEITLSRMTVELAAGGHVGPTVGARSPAVIIEGIVMLVF